MIACTSDVVGAATKNTGTDRLDVINVLMFMIESGMFYSLRRSNIKKFEDAGIWLDNVEDNIRCVVQKNIYIKLCGRYHDLMEYTSNSKDIFVSSIIDSYIFESRA